MQEMNGNSDGLMLVGIGASAGGVGALLRLFEVMPADGGLAFAVVLHTSPDHDSHLAEVLQTKSVMRVVQVTDTTRVEPNHVYCLPADRHLSLADGHVRLDESDVAAGGNGHTAPIDLFFRTLAHAYRDKAIAVVLSGAGADGSLGLGRVREEGGVSIAQDPSEAEHSMMPRSAIETGFVDFILPVAAIPGKLVSLKENAQRIQLPSPERPPHSVDEEALRELLALLRARTRHDFTSYKRSTLLRRIERRLQVTESENVREYLDYIRKNQAELSALLRDLLISVTNFFRDPEAWRRLQEQVVPSLFAGKGAGEQVRVWVAGCATGEEAYSISMLLNEHADTLATAPAIQVFATDIDEDALGQARQGLYPHTITADVSPERLKRFFVREGNYYRIRRELRESMVFAPHNILRDPPFSKLNLISCRNLLIYINRNMQERILEVFHFALKPDGHLFLGTSESADGFPDLFKPIDKKYRLFKRITNSGDGFRAALPPPVPGEWSPRPATIPQMPPLAPAQGGRAEGFTYGELHYRLIEALTPPSVLVSSEYDVLHMSEHAGRYLQPAGGEMTRNLLRLAHPDLRLELRSLLISAAQEGKAATGSASIQLDGGRRLVRAVVRPFATLQAAQGFLLVTFEEGEAQPAAEAGEEGAVEVPVLPTAAFEPLVRQLEAELERTREQMRATVEEYETSTEELKAANEELQAMNEELRSASEELETGKEELQSVNEELTTLNNELREKVDEIGRSNSDLQNLMASTRIATIFLDRSLRLKRYTPTAQGLFNIIPGDVGRPLAHITHRLDYAEMVDDAERVIRDLHTVEREIASADDGRHHLARLLPYRTTDDKIGGVVLTFTDITERKGAELALRETEARSQAVANLVPDLLWESEPDGSTNWYNQRWMEYTGQTSEEAAGWGWADALHPEDRGESERVYGEAVGKGVPHRREHRIRRHDGAYRWFVVNTFPLKDEGGRVVKVYSAATDIHEQRAYLEQLRASEERLRLVVETAEDYAIMLIDADGRYTDWNRGAERMFGYARDEAVGQPVELIFTPEDREAGEPAKEVGTADRVGRASDERWHLRKDGSRFYVSGVVVALRHGRGYAKIARDLTAQKRAQDELQRAWEELDRTVEKRTAELAEANSAMRDEVERRRRSEGERLELLRRVVTTQEEERRRISRELHDQLGQSLTALRLKLEGMSAEVGPRSKLRPHIAELGEIAQRLDNDVDFLAWELRPTALDDLGLIVALSNYAQEWSKHFGVRVNFHSAGLGDARLAPLVETNLYRIAQEALNNVSKHAAATSVDILLERRGHHAVLIVEDNGSGFDPEQERAPGAGRGMGLVGMRERAALVGGEVEIESRPGAGAAVFVRVPVRPEPEGGTP